MTLGGASSSSDAPRVQFSSAPRSAGPSAVPGVPTSSPSTAKSLVQAREQKEVGGENLRDKGPPSASTAAHFLQIPLILKDLRAGGGWRAL